MNSKLEALFEQPGKRYLDAADLSILSQYASSIPERLKVYRLLRDQEVVLLQPVADLLQQQRPDLSAAVLERSLRNGLLLLRYVALAMLMDDPAYVSARLQSWLPEMIQSYNSQAVDLALHELLSQRLAQLLLVPQFNLLRPSLEQSKALIARCEPALEPTSAPLIG
jgi:Phycobilisome protein